MTVQSPDLIAGCKGISLPLRRTTSGERAYSQLQINRRSPVGCNGYALLLA